MCLSRQPPRRRKALAAASLGATTGPPPSPTRTFPRISLGNVGSADRGGRLVHRALHAGVFARACVEGRVVGAQPGARQALEEVALAAFLDRAPACDIAARA